MKVFRSKLESACLSIHMSVFLCVSPSVYKILMSVKALVGVLSQFSDSSNSNQDKAMHERVVSHYTFSFEK